MNGLDSLDDDLKNEAGETPQGETATGYDLVEQSLPDADHKLLARWVQRYKLADDDPFFGQYLTARVTFASAAAAGQAAEAVKAGVAQIPDQIFSGAGRAADEVKGALVSGGKLFVEGFVDAAGKQQKVLITLAQDQQRSILDAAALGADKIKAAAGTLTDSLDKAVEAKKNAGVADFAKAAALAGERAARGSMAAQLSRSAVVSVLAFLVAVLIGAGGLWGWLLLTHRVMPQGVVALADPLRGGTLVMVPTGGHVVRQCPAGLCLIYSSKLPDLP